MAEHEQWLIALGQVLRRERQAQHLSIEALAFKAGMSPGRVGQIECGQFRLLVRMLYDLAQALGVTIVALMVAADAEAAEGGEA